MISTTVMGSNPSFQQGPQILIPYTLDPYVPLNQQTLPTVGGPVVRPSDGTQWNIAGVFQMPGFSDRLVLVLTLVTPPTDPVQTLNMNDAINVGS